MAKFKNIRVRKPGGGTRLQRVQVLKNGKYKFVKNKTRSRSPTRSRTRKKTGRKKTMARKRRYVRKARSFGGSMKPVIDGLMVGAASGFLRGKVPYADPIATLGIGYFRNNTTLKVMGGVELGEALLGGLFNGGNGSGGVR